VGGLSLATVLTLFVVPIVYVLLDRLCLSLTGHTSAAGLKRARQIQQDTERVAHQPAKRADEWVPAK